MTAAAAPDDTRAPGASGPSPEETWADAELAAAILAIDPAGVGGAVVRAQAGPVRDRWLARFRDLMPEAAPLRRVPLHVGEERLLGGLDLAATLGSGTRVAERGLLAEADGGAILLTMAERLDRTTVAHVTAALDTGEVVLERDGLGLRAATRFGAVALDESTEGDPRPAAALLDRLALHLDLRAVGLRAARGELARAEEVARARERLPRLRTDAEIVEALCAAALALGVDSLRVPFLALRVAQAHAALAARKAVAQADVEIAARLVLAPRMTRVPSGQESEEPEQPEEPEEPEPEDSPPDNDDDGGEEEQAPDAEQLAEIVLAAAQAALPPDALARLRLAQAAGGRSAGMGRAGQLKAAKRRGRPVGVRRGQPQAGQRLNVVATLRNAAPWQPLRRREGGPPVEVRADDFRVTRYKHRGETTTIFVVDASGSAALARLAEAKGAVELLLAESYRRRDQVAVIAFRGKGAEVLLPPTRSLARAKRSLAGLPGGGGTPLAAGLDAAAELAESVAHKGSTPVVVLLTDGRANVTREGTGGRARAAEDAQGAARRLAAEGVAALFVDTSPHGDDRARALAEVLRATYLPLPQADAATLSRAVRANAEANAR